jgi:hypothetical protein
MIKSGFTKFALSVMLSLAVTSRVVAQDASPASAPVAPAPVPAGAAKGNTPGHVTFYQPVPGKKGKFEYVGPKTLVELAPTPLLDEEGRQRLDPEGKPMFNKPIQQQRDKHGNPLFDDNGKPVMQTAAELGFDDKGKKIHENRVKPPKTISVSIERGILAIDGMPGKAGLNYEIKDLKFIYFYAPWIGITIVSHAPFPGAIEQKDAFDDKTLTVTVEDHTLQLSSDKRLLGKKPESAYLLVDRSFKLPSQSPVMGFGDLLHPPYAWPGSRENAALKGPVAAPALPSNLRPVSLLQPCPPGQMRTPGKTPLPGENLPPQGCVPLQKAIPGAGGVKPAETKPNSAPATPPAAAPAITPEAPPTDGPATSPINLPR